MSLQLAFSAASIVLCFATSIPKPSEKRIERQNPILQSQLLLKESQLSVERMHYLMETMNKKLDEIKKNLR